MNKKYLVPLGIGMVALFGGLAVKQLLFAGGAYVERYSDGRVIPPGGLLRNPYNLDGLENDGEKDFRQLSKAMLNYAKEKNKLPDDPRELIAFTASWPENEKVTLTNFFSNDYKKSDYYNSLDDGFNYAWVYRGNRPDGSPFPPTPTSAERNVWIYTDVYLRNGQKVFRDGSLTNNPYGYHLVLWSDGKVERLSPNERVTFKTAWREGGFGFRGEAGLPKQAEPAIEKRAYWWPDGE